MTLSTETQDFFFFFAGGSSAVVRAEHESTEIAWLVGTLVAPSVQGQILLSCQELWPFFEHLVAGDQKASLASLSP